jgi:hypothetical protein
MAASMSLAAGTKPRRGLRGFGIFAGEDSFIPRSINSADEVKTGAKSASAFRRRGDLRRGRHCTPHFARNSDL